MSVKQIFKFALSSTNYRYLFLRSKIHGGISSQGLRFVSFCDSGNNLRCVMVVKPNALARLCKENICSI